MNEKSFSPSSGYLMLCVLLITTAATIYLGFEGRILLMMIGVVVSIFILAGFFTIYPNGSKVMTLFGKYSGTIKQDGFFWTVPFYIKRSVSLRARNFDSDRVKVNDKIGNPILISVILVWRVKDTFKAAFEVDDYEHFVKVQSDSAVRKLAGHYPYDNFDDDQAEITLRSGLDEVNESLERELQERLEIAGLEVIEARIGYLAYASEIANAMLKRQQAEAIVAARFKIVEGAVGMVDQALEQLSEKDILHLDDEKRATMVSNLMVVLCADREVTPVVNTGTLYQ
jgi:regulator of protease activity HflC (stomatin/prohibitin superfamily)